MLFRFAAFELDDERWQLRRGSDVVQIAPTPLRLLHYLLVHRDRTISSVELLRDVWPDVTVSKDSVVRAVRDARAALGEAAKPRLLVTHRGFGYRIGVEVSAVDGEMRGGDSLFAGRESSLANLEGALERTLEGPDRARGCDLLLELAEAQDRGGDPAEAVRSRWRAVELARGLGDLERECKAAIGLVSTHGDRRLAPDAEVIAALQQVVTALDSGRSPLLARALAALATALEGTSDAHRCAALSHRAVSIVREFDDERAHLEVLKAHLGHQTQPEDDAERHAICRERLRLSRSVGDREQEFFARMERLSHRIELAARPQVVDRELEECAALAAELRQPLHASMVLRVRACLALIRGRLTESNALAAEALEVGRRADPANAVQAYYAHRLTLYRWLGRSAELSDEIETLLRSFPGNPIFLLAAAAVYGEIGKVADALQMAKLVFERLDRVPARNLVMVRSALSEVCTAVGDEVRAAELYDRLLPYAGRWGVMANIFFPSGCISRCLGNLATTLERWEEAEHHFDISERVDAQVAAAFLPFTLHDGARMLLRRDQAGDRQQALDRIKRGLEIAQGFGMTGTTAQLDSLRALAQGG